LFIQALFIVCSAITSDAGNLPAWIQQSRPSDAPNLAIPAFERINESIQKKGSVKVIVRLVPPASLNGGFVVEGKLPDQSAMAIQRSHIAQIQTRISNLLSKQRAATAKRFDFIHFMAMEVSAAEFQALAASQDIDLIEEDIPVPPTLFQSVPLVGGVSGIFNGFTGSGQTVAILDTGVDKTHPFLTGKIVAEACYSTNYVPDSATAVCSYGSTATGSGAPCAISGCEHGTHVAGIAAGNGTSNGTQFSGVAKDANVIAIQVFSRFVNDSDCGGPGTAPCVLSYTSDQISALNQVYNLKDTYSIAAVNMSLGGGTYSTNCDSDSNYTSEKAAIDTLRSVGIATAIASGNSSYTNAISAPACISTAISVGATDKSDVVASYSNSASILKLLAPGSAIYSSIPGGGFAYLSGTSMATPHVTGAWAVLKSAKPTATVDQVLNALTSTGKSVNDTRNSIVKPRIQLDAAVNALKPPATNYTLSVSKVGSGTGTITSNPKYGITCGSTCSSIIPVPQGNTVSLSAVPDVGSVFVGWNGGVCSGTTNPCIVASASGDMVVQAIFLSGATTIDSVPFSGSSVPSGWTNPGGIGKNWSFGTSPCNINFIGGGKFAFIEDVCTSSPQNIDSSLISPSYDLSRYAGVSLSFKTYFVYWWYSTADVDVSNDGGASWTNIWRKGPPVTNGTIYGPATESVDISSLAAGKANLKVRFRYYTNNSYGEYWEINNFALYGAVISAPAVSNESATPTGFSATLNGYVNDDNATTTVTFQYGHTDDYGSNVSAGTIVIGSGPTPVSAAVSGLTCNTTYHFRLVASNSAGTTNGTDHTFMTTPCVPGATTITSAKAGNTQASIYYSPPDSDGGGSITGYIATSSAGTTQPSLLIPITVSGLINGASYDFTVTAINSAGPGTTSTPSNSVIPGLVLNSESDAIGYLTIQAAYTALNNNNAEIHIQAGEQVGDFVKASSGTIVIIGAYDSTFTVIGNVPSFLSNLTISGGTTKVQHVVVRPNGP
jgi:ethanolamine utilization microcompartment shell protein EutS